MSLYSTYWYKIASIKPRLRSHVLIHRHVYRGQNWYVLQDLSADRRHRFNKASYGVIALVDGTRTVQEIWDASIEALGDDALTQDEVIQLFGQLHRNELLKSDIAPDIAELFERRKNRPTPWKQRFMNPLALRFPLFDPDAFLLRWLPFFRPLMNRAGFALWAAIVGLGFILALYHWSDLTHDLTDRLLTPKNLVLLWLVFPVVKLFHELGHAFAIRRWGGEVHEMGIMLLAFTPIPYVEASSSAAFPEKKRRMAVAAAGIMVELCIASIALFVWLSVEQGRVSAIAYNVMLIGGVSTLLFNGNPLLRFDGYYIFSDWVEIPNLSKRSISYLGYLFQHYLIGIKECSSPVTARGEEGWLFFYGVAAFLYRLVIFTTIVLFIGSKFFIVGVFIAIWAVSTQMIYPAVLHSYRFLGRASGRRKRVRIFTVATGMALIVCLLLFIVPVPLRTMVQGVVAVPEHSQLRAGTDCFVTEMHADDGDTIVQGQVLLRCEDPFLNARVKLLEANLDEAKVTYNAESLKARVQREILREQIRAAEADLAEARQRKEELIIRSPGSGILVLAQNNNLVGSYLRQGERIGYILGNRATNVIVVIDQANIALVREKTEAVRIRLAGNLGEPFIAEIEREIPAASGVLPSAALGTMGGGSILVDPADKSGIRVLGSAFQFEIRLPEEFAKDRIGERAFLLFDHGFEPLAMQWYRLLRQLFLRKFNV